MKDQFTPVRERFLHFKFKFNPILLILESGIKANSRE
jgi:hypothetical protein